MVLVPFRFIALLMGTDLGRLAKALDNLVDERTRLVCLRLGEERVLLPCIVAAIIKDLGCPPESVMNMEEIRTLLISQGVTLVVVLFSDAHLLSTPMVQRLLKIFDCLGEGPLTFSIIVDDVASLTRLPLPLQLGLCMETVTGRRADEVVLEVVSNIIAVELVPSSELIRSLIECVAGSRTPWTELRQILRLSVLEYSLGHTWSAERYRRLPSFARSFEEGRMGETEATDEEVKEHGDALFCDAKTWLASLHAFWRVLLTLRELFDSNDRIFPASELFGYLGNLAMVVPKWLDALRTQCFELDDENLVRRLRILERRLEGFPGCTIVKDLRARIKSVLEDVSGKDRNDQFVIILQEWFSAHWLCPLEQQPLHEAIILSLGPATRKLTNPRLFETILLGLENPLFYVEGTLSSPDQPSSSHNVLTDTGRVHALAVECGKFINIHDWYVSFRTSVDPERRAADSQLMVRFLRAAYELQLFGFVAPTKKRKDHCERLLLFHPVHHQ